MQAVWALALVLALVLIPTAFGRLRSADRMLKLRSSNTGAVTPQTNAALRIASYNIAHGRGNGLGAQNWTDESPTQRRERLDEIATLLREVNADVVVLNEVDFNSSWSHGMNQARYLAEKAGYPYWVEERNLDLRFLHWTWRFGNAVLSRHPIAQSKVINLPGFSQAETLIAGKKRGVLCDIQLGDETVRVAGVHLCHRSKSVREKSAGLLVNLAAASPYPFIVAGDLNAAPGNHSELTTRGQAQGVLETLDLSDRFTRMANSPTTTKEMTFHSARPSSVIDWILIPRNWRFHNYAVVPSELSDHRLVYADTRVDSDEM